MKKRILSMVLILCIIVSIMIAFSVSAGAYSYNQSTLTNITISGGYVTACDMSINMYGYQPGTNYGSGKQDVYITLWSKTPYTASMSQDLASYDGVIGYVKRNLNWTSPGGEWNVVNLSGLDWKIPAGVSVVYLACMTPYGGQYCADYSIPITMQALHYYTVTTASASLVNASVSLTENYVKQGESTAVTVTPNANTYWVNPPSMTASNGTVTPLSDNDGDGIYTGNLSNITNASTITVSGKAAYPSITINDGTGAGSPGTTLRGTTSGSLTSGSNAVVGETITVTPKPALGYKVKEVKYNDGADHVLTLTSGNYSFIMPKKAITVSVTYERDDFSASVSVNKNGIAWNDVSSDKVVLSTSSTNAAVGQKTGTPSGGVFSFTGLDSSTTYSVWVKNKAGTYVYYTSVSLPNQNAAVNYYDVNLFMGTGIASVSGSGTYLANETTNISATLLSGYSWLNWSDNNTTMTNRLITVNKKYDLTANASVVAATAPTVNTTGATLTYGYTGGTISVTATPASGHTITGYQWYTCNSSGSNKTILTGATSATYTIPAGKAAGSYYYVCDVTTTRTDNSETKTITTTPATLVTVNKCAITVTMNAKNRDFGEANPAFDFRVTSGSLVNDDTNAALAMTGSTTATQTSNAGTYPITGSSTSANYHVTIVSGALTIDKKVPQSSDFTYDLTTASYDGNNQGVTASPKTGSATIVIRYNGSTTLPTEPGTYPVTIDVSNATNYTDITGLDLGNYTIEKATVGSFILSSNRNPSTYEDEITLTATVDKAGNGAVPAGTITFKNGPTTLATAALTNGTATISKSDLPAGSTVITAEYSGDSRYRTASSNNVVQTVTKKPMRFTVVNTEYSYTSGIARTVDITGTGSLLTKNDFTVRYYRVDENNDILESIVPVVNAITAGKYLYVIDFATSSSNYEITRQYRVLTTDLPTLASYDNVGYMEIKTAQSGQQKPIFFTDGAVSVYLTDSTYINLLTNENASAITYKSSNDAIAQVAADGTVTLKKAGTVTITATSTLAGTTPVYASYLLTIQKMPVTVTAQADTCVFGSVWDKSTGVTYSDGLNATDFSGSLDFETAYLPGAKVGDYQIMPKGLTSDDYAITFVPAVLTVTPKTLTAGDFSVNAADKSYDGTTVANVTASIVSGLYSGNSVKAEVSGSFTAADASDAVTVQYTLTGLTGKDADNYQLDGGSMDGTTTAAITPATVYVICATNTTRTFDGNAQSVDLSAMANGMVFDRSNYTVRYSGADSATNVGVYAITVIPASPNYVVKPFTATLTIREASQEVFSIENVPERVYYGDAFRVSSQDASGNVVYTLNDGAPAAIDNNGNFVATGVGSVRITATSTRDGYTTKIATKTFQVYPRVVTPVVTAENRVYNAETGVTVTVNLENVLPGDNLTASGTGVMANADAGTDKIVYVNGITLSGTPVAFYTLETTTRQTTVSIAKADITGFSVSAQSKKYDGTVAASAAITAISGVYPDDLGQVSLDGSAVFANEAAGLDKTVTYTATTLTGAKAANYQFADEAAKTGRATADITSMNIGFIIGTATFQYDGQGKAVITSASDELGRVFTDYAVEYWQNGLIVTGLPSDAGNYDVKFVLNDPANYTTAQSDISMSIAQANQEQLTIIGLPSTIEYSDEFTLEAVGGSGNGEVEWESDNRSVVVDPNGNVTINGAIGETVTITATKRDDVNFTEKTTQVVLIPTTKTTTFVLSDFVQTYSGDGKAVTVTPDISGATYAVTYNGNSVLPTDAGIYYVLVTATGNYKGSATATLTINKARMSDLGVIQTGCTYGELLADALFDDAPDGVDVRVTYSTFDGEKPRKAGDYRVTATYTGDNYETFTASSGFEIAKKPLTVKATDQVRGYGEANPVFSFIYEGFVNGEDERVLLSEPVAVTMATPSSPVSNYAISISGGRADNYAFIYDNSGMITITGATGGSFYITGANNSVTVGDIFTLHAYYENVKPAVTWHSSDESVASVDANGMITVLKKGAATITAVICDPNYQSGIRAEFTLNAAKKVIQLTPADLVKVYNTNRQDLTLLSDETGFVPILSGEQKNIDISYVLTTDSSVTEPKQAGVYTVTYSINHPSYTGGNTVTMYINKATVTVHAQDVRKVYGDANPAYNMTGLIGTDAQNPVYIAQISELFDMTSDADSTGKKANAGEYPIRVAVKAGKTLNDDANYTLVISDTNGTLRVDKAPLTVLVSDATRKYAAQNVNPAYDYAGFVNGESESDLTAKPVFTYDAGVTTQSAVGSYPDVITASAAQSNNYDISYRYTDGTGADLMINQLLVNVAAGDARSNYLTVNFDKAIAGLTKDSFSVKLGGTDVDLTSVSANSTNTVYTLIGSFNAGSNYAVTVTANDNYELAGLPLSLTPIAPADAGGNGGGSLPTVTYKITVTQADGGNISPDTVRVDENGSMTFAITPNDGYEIEDVLVNGKSVGNVTAYTFDNIKSAASITATFKKADVEPEVPEEPGNAENWENPFSDVQTNDWYYEAVKYVSEKGLMNGTDIATFAPNTAVTRAMFVTVFYRTEAEPNEEMSLFADIESGSYYEKAVDWAAAHGIVKGISATEFAPNSTITREQMAVIIQRYVVFKGLNVIESSATSYADNASISDYARDAVAFCTELGIMSGKGESTFAPQDYVTRAEVAVVLERMLKILP